MNLQFQVQEHIDQLQKYNKKMLQQVTSIIIGDENMFLDQNNIVNIQIFDKCKNIVNLEIKSAQIEDLYVFRKKKTLQRIKLFYCRNVRMLENLKKLDKITEFRIGGLYITSINVIQSFKQLKVLQIKDCQLINKFNVLNKCKLLNELYLESVCITDLSFLQHMLQLTILSIQQCSSITNFDVIQECKFLKELFVVSTNINNIKPIINLENLYTIQLLDNKLLPTEFSIKICKSQMQYKSYQKWCKLLAYFTDQIKTNVQEQNIIELHVSKLLKEKENIAQQQLSKEQQLQVVLNLRREFDSTYNEEFIYQKVPSIETTPVQLQQQYQQYNIIEQVDNYPQYSPVQQDCQLMNDDQLRSLFSSISTQHGNQNTYHHNRTLYNNKFDSNQLWSQQLSPYDLNKGQYGDNQDKL